MVCPAVNEMVEGTAALGFVGVFIVPEGAVKMVPVPAEDAGVNGKVKTTVLAVVAVLTTWRNNE